MFTWAAAFLIRPRARMNSRGKPQTADLEVPRRALRLGPVVGLGRDLHLAHRIAFRPGRGQSKILHALGKAQPAAAHWRPSPASPVRATIHDRDYSIKIARIRHAQEPELT